MAYVRVAGVDDIKNAQAKAVVANGQKIAIYNLNGTFYAIDEVCPHKGGPLAAGLVSEQQVTCPWHGAVFSLVTGRGIDGPCGNGVRCYPVRVVNGDLEVDVD